MESFASKKHQWILGSFNNDLLGLFLPGYFGLICVSLFSSIPTAAIIIGFVSLVLIDSGHVYTTFLRGPFFKFHNKAKTLASLFSIFLFLFFWLYFQIPYFWSFVVYYTLFHHVRQYVGLIKWYNKLEQYHDSILIYLFYASVLISMLLFHTDPNQTLTYYSFPGDVLYFPSQTFFNYLIFAQVLIWLIYVGYTGYVFFILKLKPFKTHLFFVLAILFYFLVCMSNRNTPLVLVPILFAHGIPYILLIYHSRKKLKPNQTKIKVLGILSFVVLFMSIFEYAIQEYVVDYEYLNGLLFPKILLALFLTPLIFHYVIDGYIWKSKHFLASKIYS